MDDTNRPHRRTRLHTGLHIACLGPERSFGSPSVADCSLEYPPECFRNNPHRIPSRHRTTQLQSGSCCDFSSYTEQLQSFAATRTTPRSVLRRQKVEGSVSFIHSRKGQRNRYNGCYPNNAGSPRQYSSSKNKCPHNRSGHHFAGWYLPERNAVVKGCLVWFSCVMGR